MANNAIIRTKEAKERKSQAPEVEAGDDEDEDDAGVDGAVPETVVILTFMPWSQWPNVPQAKYRVPGLSNLTTSFPLFLESNAVPRSHFL